jgi:hypothetical protein
MLLCICRGCSCLGGGRDLASANVVSYQRCAPHPTRSSTTSSPYAPSTQDVLCTNKESSKNKYMTYQNINLCIFDINSDISGCVVRQ